MQRIKNHKIKREIPETSSARLKDNEEHDLAFYIHDRVELMHQVFSVIKPKELKAMAPECVQHISIDDLQELCTEELLGISSKRLCAILDGAEAPSDTESSGSEQMETISLDSISSDDEMLSQPCPKNKKHKHKKHKSKVKDKRKNSNSSDKDKEEVEDRSKASRAGLTVLELLELQARARAIRAQLQQDNINMPTEQIMNIDKCDSSDEVEIKEEPPEVVEISSEDEKPKIEDLLVKSKSPLKEERARATIENSTTVKRINNLIITVPQSKPSRKIKLKRNKIVTISMNTDKIDSNKDKSDRNYISNDTSASNVPVKTLDEQNSEQSKTQGKLRKKQKKKSKTIEKDGSDHDEITLQLSDTEKMDLLEDFNRKDYESFTSSDSKDSESSSENESDDLPQKSIDNKEPDKDLANIITSEMLLDNNDIIESFKISDKFSNEKLNHSKEIEKQELRGNDDIKHSHILGVTSQNKTIVSNEKVNILDNKVVDEEIQYIIDNSQGNAEFPRINSNEDQIEEGEIVGNVEMTEDLSEGELSNKNISETDPCNVSTQVVCISDEENRIIKNVKVKKKEKNSKKEKRSKKSKQNFLCNSSNQNVSDSTCKKSDELIHVQKCLEENLKSNSDNIVTIYDDDNEILEILELSDDSCYYDTDGDSVLSKEPTAAEIAALSAKIDDIPKHIVSNYNTKKTLESIADNEVQNISWRDRYLGSNKVKKVLTTASILNALRKKNKEIKTKLGVTKNYSDMIKPQVCETKSLIEGSLDQFTTLEASTKYVNPIITENIEENKNEGNNENKVVTKEMEKDAKLLLKMYKKLLKYNDMNKQKDPNKNKKKKQKKNKDKEKVKTSE